MSLRHHSTLSQIAVLLGFMTGVGLIAYLELRRLLFAWINRRENPKPGFWPGAGARAERALTRCLHAVSVLGMGCVLYGWLWEPTDIEVVTVPVLSAKIRPESGVIRIVHVSDLHSDPGPLNEPAAARMIRGLNPDIIVVTGDFINTEGGLPVARDFIRSLTQTATTFLVTGNFDIGRLPKGAFAGLPAKVLDLETAEVRVRGTPLRITGFAVETEPLFSRYRRHLVSGPAYDIFLSHYTDLADEAAQAGIDLYLAGHTHGGQVRLPFYGALVTLAKTGKRFEAGLYRVADMVLYVNRGLGLEGGRAPRVRFLCRPEITVLELRNTPRAAAQSPR